MMRPLSGGGALVVVVAGGAVAAGVDVELERGPAECVAVGVLLLTDSDAAASAAEGESVDRSTVTTMAATRHAPITAAARTAVRRVMATAQKPRTSSEEGSPAC